MINPTEQINADAENWAATLSDKNSAEQFIKEINDEEFDDKIKYIPTPNFTDCSTAGTQLPINVANETINVLSKYRSEFDFVDFIKEKLNYNSRIAVCMSFFSEQIDAMILAIKQFESNKALILGDMAGIGKGRVCAGILRYAYQNNITPVFITEKENLFSEMYKDIVGIGGFGGNGGNEIMPKPFIMNPYTSDRKSIIQDDNGNELFLPPTRLQIDGLLKNFKGEFPFKKKDSQFDFNCVFLTYNVISKTRGESGDNKRLFLRQISGKSIFIFDECHNASGASKLGAEAKILVTEAKGVLFSSATFAKNPQSFPLYIIKTAMAEAQIDITSIEKAISVGGENVSEYISSILVKEGQMIRRERDFSGCTMGTIYDGYDESDHIKSEEVKDNIYKVFDEATSKFRAIYKYIKQEAFGLAIRKAVQSTAQDLELNLASQDDYNKAKTKEDLQKEFISKNKGKYIIASYDKNTLGVTTKFHYTENILIAIKAKFTADAIIKELRTQVEYENKDGKKHKTNRKPVIALRATGENLFRKLNLKNGDTLNNDFSEYIRAVVSGVMNGKVVFRKINNDLFTPKWKMEEDEKEFTEEVGLFEINNSDLPDGGARLERLLEDVASYNAQIPLSTIDYLIDKIQSEQRESWDRYGSTSVNYKVGEVTGRNFSLIKDKNSDKWILSHNEREKAVKSSFINFNNGKYDVLILNSSGSTGGSIHSSETFVDKRPRIMFILQIELDVNTEVQKRGRINRSGQVNFPAYLYILSQIPSEIRKFLSLKRKLRKLDANTSANQTQNSDIVGIKDKNGNPIQDVFNIYGEEAFQNIISNPENFELLDIYLSMINNYSTGEYTEEYAQDGDVVKALLQPFSRELEIYGCDLQEHFYDLINLEYGTVIESHKNNGTYHLELDIEDLKASLRTRVVKQLNSGITEFSKPLFMEDKYCLESKRLWTDDKVKSEIEKMAVKFYSDREDDFTNITKFHNDLLEDFDTEYDTYSEFKINEYRSKKEPIRDEYISDEDYNEELEKYESELADYSVRFDSEKSLIRDLISYYKPNKPIVFTQEVGSGENAKTIKTKGKFIGYNLKSTSQQNKYSRGSIYFKFALMSGFDSSIEININKNKEQLSDIKRTSQATFSASGIGSGGKTFGEMAFDEVNAWVVNPHNRRTVRFLSGNILSGVQIANNMSEIKRWSLVKYTNNDGSVSTSIRLDYPEGEFSVLALSEKDKSSSQEKIQVSLINEEIITYLKETPTDYSFNVGVNTFSSRNVPYVVGGQEIIVDGLIKITKPTGQRYIVNVEIFQGIPDRKTKDKSGEVKDYSIPLLNTSSGNNPIFFAPFLENYTIYGRKIYTKSVQRLGGYDVYNADFTNRGGANGVKYKSGFSKIYNFKDIDTEQGASALKMFFNDLYNEQPLSLGFPQNISDYYNVIFQTDTYKQKAQIELEGKSVSLFEEDNYEYKLDVDFNDNFKNPPNFIEYKKGQSSFDKGTIILGQPLLPTFAFSFGVYPINFSNDDTIKLLLSIFNQDERADFVSKLTERAESGQSSNQIGDFVSSVSQKRAVSDLKYIFGKRRVSDIGELLKTYALKGDISKIEYEITEDSNEVVKPISKKTKITVEDAEKFINYLLF